VCVDCYSKGCPAGLLCIDRACSVDPCAGKTCGAGQFCSAGACVPSCAGVVCGTAQVCQQGVCVKATCPQTCDRDSFCDVKAGTCRPSPCSAIACPAGTLCVNTTGQCANNPCEQVHCGKGQNCVVGDDGSPDCAIPAVTGATVQTQAAGSGIFGCTCSVASPTRNSRHSWLHVLGVAAAAGILLRRRRARSTFR